MIDSPHLSPHDEAREREHARREEKARRLFGLPRAQMKKQREHLVLLPKQWIHTDGTQIIESYRTRYAIVYTHCPPHQPQNFEPANHRYHVFVIDRSTNAPAESLGILLSVAESLDAAIVIAARIDGNNIMTDHDPEPTRDAEQDAKQLANAEREEQAQRERQEETEREQREITGQDDGQDTNGETTQ